MISSASIERCNDEAALVVNDDRYRPVLFGDDNIVEYERSWLDGETWTIPIVGVGLCIIYLSECDVMEPSESEYTLDIHNKDHNVVEYGVVVGQEPVIREYLESLENPDRVFSLAQAQARARPIGRARVIKGWFHNVYSEALCTVLSPKHGRK